MNTTYVQKNSTVQKNAGSQAASVLDSSSQSESLQRKADMANNAAQLAEAPQPNNTGMPDNLKSGIESLSGFSMDDVRVHYNSSKPATVQALAYTQGTDIHVAPGQEKHLPHEAWHVAQQMAGRVSPTTNINDMPVNDNAGLEHEADVMGEKALQRIKFDAGRKKITNNNVKVYQMLRIFDGYDLVHNSIAKAKDDTLQSKLDKDIPQLKQKYCNRLEKIISKFVRCAGTFISNYKIGKETVVTDPISLSESWNQEDKDAYLKALEYLKKEFKGYFPNYKSEYINDLLKCILNSEVDSYKERMVKELKYSFNNKKKVGIDENIVILAHGNRNKYADNSPKNFAHHLKDVLPKNYRGEIYLAGCLSGFRDEKTGKSYIEDLQTHLKRHGFAPSLKGNLGTSCIIEIDKSVHVAHQTATKCEHGKETKLHINPLE